MGLNLSPEAMAERLRRIREAGPAMKGARPRKMVILGGRGVPQPLWARVVRPQTPRSVVRVPTRSRIPQSVTKSRRQEIPHDWGRFPLWTLGLWAYFMVWVLTWVIF